MRSLRRILEVTKDAYNYKYNFDSTPPNEVILFITSLCNFACETCFYSEKLNDTKNDLTFEELEKISSNFKEIRLLLLTGGEPYLRKNFFEIMQMFYHNNKVRRLHLPTNGYATKKIINDTTRMLSELPKLEINIGVSVDALYERHDFISKKTGAFDRAMETQRLLIDLEKKHKNLSTKFYTVLSNDNIEESDKLFEYIVKEFGFEKIGFSPLRGDPANPSLKSPTPLEWDRLYNMYKKYEKTKPLDFKQFLINRKMKNFHSMNKKALSGDGFIKNSEKNFGKFSCSAGNNICVIDADGEVRVCELKDPVGNLRNHDYDIRKILNKKQKHNCTCTHACFQNASIDVSPVNYIKQFI